MVLKLHDPGEEGGDVLNAVPSQMTEVLVLVAGLLMVRAQLYKNACASLDLKSRQTELEAVSSLLLGVCDSVVEVDKDLRLTEDSRQISTALFHGEHVAEGLAGTDLLGYFSEEDRSRIQAALGQAGQGSSLEAKMLDPTGGSTRVELIHTQFSDVGGRPCRLIGLREAPDTETPAPLFSEAGEASPVCGEASLIFDAGDFGILDVSEGFRSLSERHAGRPINFEGLSIFDLSKGTGPASFSRQLQSAVNAFSEAPASPRMMRNLDLLGVCRVHAKVKLQHDHILETLVGTVTLTGASGVAAEARRRPRRASRALRSEADRSGSILALRRPVMSL